MEFNKRILLIISLLFLLPNLVFATTSTPLGLWQTYDLKHKPRSIVRISQTDGELIGTIVKSDSDTVCKTCTGDLQNKRVKGLKIIWGLQRQGEIWSHGHVLNIDNGKTYRCNLKVSDDNKVLNFSAYVGVPMLGVTIKWHRISG